MATLPHVLGMALLTIPTLLHSQTLDQAEVRIPYGELKQLLARAETAARPETPEPALLSARLILTTEDSRPVVSASFRSTSFTDEPAFVSLLGGDLALESQDPEDATIITKNNALCQAIHHTGTHKVQLRLLPVSAEGRFKILIPPCPSLILETGDFPEGQSIALGINGSETIVGPNRILPLPLSARSLNIRLLDSKQSREATRPPEPSTWSWQHIALVTPSDGELIYQIITRASANEGSGVEATLPIPPGARNLTITGDDLTGFRKQRGENRATSAILNWKTRAILDRQVTISYNMPLRPLDPTWKLQAPGGAETRTRFVIASSPGITYSADGLSPALAPQGIPSPLAKSLDGNTCHILEAAATTELTATAAPVAATADGVVSTAEWLLSIEPDGATLLSGTIVVEHKGPLDFKFDTPEDMRLLSCTLGGKKVSPIDLGNGVLQIALAPHGEKSSLHCAFTGTGEALDPVEGTARFSLPRIPMFIHSLLWQIDLPAGYQAETHGNLSRIPPADAKSTTRIQLRKNLCRDERPDIRVFYQRSDLKSQ